MRHSELISLFVVFAYCKKYYTVMSILANRWEIHAGVAQLAEQLTCNQQVVGSIPITSSTSN